MIEIKLEKKLSKNFNLWKINGIFIELISNILSEENYSKFIKLYNNIESNLKNRTSMAELSRSHGIKSIIKLLSLFPKELKEEYIRYFTNENIKNLRDLKLSSYGDFAYGKVMSVIFNKKHYAHLYSDEKVASEALFFKEIIIDHGNMKLRETIKDYLINKKDLSDIFTFIGVDKPINIAFNEYNELFIEYVKYSLKKFTKDRKSVTYMKLLDSFKITSSPAHHLLPVIREKIKELVDIEYKTQCELFIKENTFALDLDKDYWTLYFMNGPAINKCTYDFSKIVCTGIRYEVKSFMREKLKNKKNSSYTIFHMITIGFNYIAKINPKLNFCTDITSENISSLILYLEKDYITQSGENMKPSSIRKVVQGCGAVVQHLISKGKDLKLKTPIPFHNYFSDITFYNSKNMEKRTDILPEEVINKIASHIDTLSPIHKLIYYIFIDSGLRLKEIIYLEDNCIQPSKYKNVKKLRYIPFKILRHRRKKKLSDHAEILISQELASKIALQIEKSKALREKYKIPYIFVNELSNQKAHMTKGRGFVVAIQNLINNYKITDTEDNLWNFQSRQFRKTIVTTMIENGASTTEVAHWLGHLSKKTAKEYYEEIRKSKLVDLNTEFFKKKFELKIGEAQLKQYSEEELKLLYVDFRLNIRRVPLGHCTKHLSEKECGYEVGKIDCAVCSKLATGCSYLDEWISLRDSKQQVIDELIRIYKANNITNYHNFREYQRELYYLNSYQSVIDNIVNFSKKEI